MDNLQHDFFEEVKHFPIFYGVSRDGLKELLKHAVVEHFEVGAHIIREAEQGDAFYVLISGELQITKKHPKSDYQHIIATSQPGDTVGELILFNNSVRSSTVTATQNSLCLRFDKEAVSNSREDLSKLIANAGRKVAERLSYTNKVTADHMQELIDQNKKRIGVGLFMTTVFFITSVYALMVRSLAVFIAEHDSTFATAIMLSVFALICYFYAKRSGYPLKTYGVSWGYSRGYLGETLLYSLVGVLVVTAVKMVLMIGQPHHLSDYFYLPTIL